MTTISGLPVAGFVDLSSDSMQVDLKTATKVPSAVSRGARKGFLPASKAANTRQQAIYSKARPELETGLLYVSPEDVYYHKLTLYEIEEAMFDVEKACLDIKELVNMPIEEIIKATEFDWEKTTRSFFWDDETRKAASEIWLNF